MVTEWTYDRQPGDDEECDRLGCEDRTHPVAHPVPSLSDAWAQALRVLPVGWGLVLSSRDGMHDAYAINPALRTTWTFSGTGPTPAAAVLDLAATLRR